MEDLFKFTFKLKKVTLTLNDSQDGLLAESEKKIATVHCMVSDHSGNQVFSDLVDVFVTPFGIFPSPADVAKGSKSKEVRQTLPV